MRVLVLAGSTAALVLLVVTGLASTLAHTPPGPPDTPDHGVNDSTFHRLWSGDVDDDTVPPNTTAIEELAAYVDIPFTHPPSAVTKWNAGDHHDMPTTDWQTAVAPQDASLTQSTFLKDAYIETFAVTPSTRVHLAPNETPLYVAPNGSVRASIDYRVDLPPGNATNDTRTTWRVIDTTVDATTLHIDGNSATTTSGTQTPILAYRDLDEYVGTEHQFRLTARINATVERTVETRTFDCETPVDDPVNNSTCEEVWITENTTFVDSVTVADAIEVDAYEFVTSVRRVEYPNGDHGIAVRVLQPWQGFTLGNDTVGGTWRFYSARDTTWDTLTEHTANGTRRVDSPSQPLQVHAYPKQPPTASLVATPSEITVLDANGRTRPAPVLPDAIELDEATGEYRTTDRIVIRTSNRSANATLRIHGLVHGTTEHIQLADVNTTSLRSRNVTLDIEDVTQDNVTLHVELRDDETGAPVTPNWTTGTLTVNGHRIRLNTTGQATITLPRRTIYTATYHPGTWYNVNAIDTPARDDTHIAGTIPTLLTTLYHAAIPITTLLIATYLIDRITTWNIWPPWNHLT